jgi:hypothetical protein
VGSSAWASAWAGSCSIGLDLFETGPRSCLRAKLQSFHTDSQLSELDFFERGAVQNSLRDAVTSLWVACSGVKSLEVLGGRDKLGSL